MLVVRKPLGDSEYKDLRAQLFISQECDNGKIDLIPYLDDAEDNQVTIGIGFNIEGNINERNKVFRAMGLNIDDPQSIDNKYLNGIAADHSDGLNYKIVHAVNGNNAALVADLNAIMLKRYNDDQALPIEQRRNITQKDFSITSVQARIIFDQVMDEVNVDPNKDGYEHQMDLWLGGALDKSSERLAILSARYTGVTSSELRTALLTDNRYEAWFRIRYRSNGDNSHSMRRYVESSLFGLYNNSSDVSDTEANSIISFLNSTFEGGQTYLQYMQNYEKIVRKGLPTWLYASSSYAGGFNFPGIDKNLIYFQDIFKPISAQLIDHYLDGEISNFKAKDFLVGKNFDGDVVLGFEGADGIINSRKNDAPQYGFSDKRDLLVAIDDTKANTLNGGKGDDFLIGAKLNDTLDGGDNNDILVGKDGDDVLKGGKGFDELYGGKDKDDLSGGDDADHLYGGDGIDKLDGGKGNDILEGGDGADTYVFSGDFGKDIIIDSDNSGSIEIDGQLLGALKQIAQGSTVYRDDIDKPKYEAVVINEGDHQSLLISTVIKTGNAIVRSGNSITIKNWSGSGLGISLSPASTPAAPTDKFYTADGNGSDNALSLANAIDDDPNYEQKGYTSLRANGGEGNDLIMGLRGGNDSLIGGGGNDIILGGSAGDAEYGRDTLEGNEGNDYIFSSPLNSEAHGGTGSDFVRADAGGVFEVYPVIDWEGRPDVHSPSHPKLTRDQVWSDVRSIFNADFNFFGFKNITTEYKEYPSVVGGTKFIVAADNLFQIKPSDGTPATSDTYSSLAHGFSYTYHQDAQNKFQLGGFEGDPASVPLNFHMATIELLPGRSYADEGVRLFGDAGDDAVAGGIYSDYLFGGTGKDTVWGGFGNDVIDGGDDNSDDKLYGNAGNDIINGGDGNDWIEGGDYTPLTQESDNDTLFGGAGNDSIFGADGNDFIDGGSGSDDIEGWEGDDYLYGGNDGNAADMLYGGIGNDTLVLGKNDTADADAGNNIYIWDTHQVTTTPTRPTGNTVAGGSGGTNGSFGFAPNTIADETNTTSTPDAIYITNHQGNNTLGIAGLGNLSSAAIDTNGSDLSIITRDGQQLVIHEAQNSAPIQIVFGNSAEQLATLTAAPFTLTDDHFLNGIAPTDQEQVTSTDLILSSVMREIDQVASQTTHYLAGGLINDVLTADSHGTTLIGGLGDDLLNGDIGDDTYLIRLGDGNDTIIEKGGSNLIKLDIDIAVNDVSVSRQGADLILSLPNTQTVTVKNTFDATTGEVIAANSIAGVQFYDGTLWTLDTIKQNSLLGSAGDDSLDGFATNDVLTGGKGNDKLSGGAGNDVYVFNTGDGSDIITDTSGVDSIRFGAGILPAQVVVQRDGFNNLVVQFGTGSSDKIVVANAFDNNGHLTASAIESFQFADTTVWNAARIEGEAGRNIALTISGTAGNDVLKGSSSNDILIGGKGNDQILGDAGNDVYNYTLGDGNDVITDTNGVDSIQFLSTLSALNPVVRVNNNDLVFTMSDGATVTVKDMFATKTPNVVDPAITSILSQLQTRWMSQAEKLIEQYYGLVGSGDITIQFAHNVPGEAANVGISTTTQNNVTKTNLTLTIDLDDFSAQANGTYPLYNDRIIAHEMVHAILALNTNMFVLPGWFVEGTAEFIQGADERVRADLSIINNQSNFNALFKTTVGSPSSSAGYSVSYIAVKFLDNEIRQNGGAGIKDVFDQLKTGATLDQALTTVSQSLNGVSAHWTNLATFESYFKATGFASTDTLLNLNDADTGAIGGSDYGNTALTAQTVVPDNNTGPSTHFNVIVPDQYIATGNVDNKIESFTFANGTSWSIDAVKLRSLMGTDSNDVINGFDTNDFINAGRGDDRLAGGKGDDTYSYNWGDGTDVITDIAGVDRIQFFTGISESQVRVRKVNADLVFEITDGGSITVTGAFDANGNFTSNAIESAYFVGSSTTWDSTRLLQEISKNVGQVFVGTSGADTLSGSSSDDTLIGGKGSDLLYGGSGDDKYVFSLDDLNNSSLAVDTIQDSLGKDTIVLGAGITENDISLVRLMSGFFRGSLQINFPTLAPNNMILVSSMFDVNTGNVIANSAIDNIQFANGAVWDLTRIKQELTKGTAARDIIVGSNDNDTINGGGGDDDLSGLVGDDTYLFNLSDGKGNDQIEDTGGNDSIRFGEGILESDVKIRVNGRHLDIKLANGSLIKIVNLIDGTTGAFIPSKVIESIQFASGATWDFARIKAESMKGTAGADSIFGYDTNDVISAGKGADSIYAGLGNDTYQFSRGDGFDSIQDTGGTDTLAFGAGILPQDVTLFNVDNDLYAYLSNGEGVRVVGEFTNGVLNTTSAIENISFANGDTWNAATIQQKVVTTAATANLLIGKNTWDEIHPLGTANYTIYGMAGDDDITGSSGNDTISGGGGVNMLAGGDGNDTYVISEEQGAQIIKGFRNSSQGFDHIVFAEGITPDMVSVSITRPNIVVDIVDGVLWENRFTHNENWEFLLTVGEQLVYIRDQFESDPRGLGPVLKTTALGLGSIDFANGTHWDINDLAKNLPDVTPPAIPTGSFDTTGKIISGIAEAGSLVEVKNNATSATLGSVLAGANGSYSITLVTALINNESVAITAKDTAGNLSSANLIVAPDLTAPLQPTAAFDTTGKLITGSAEAGSTIEVKNSTNSLSLGSAVAAADGSYSLTLATALTNKETVNVTAKDAAGNISALLAIVAPIVVIPNPTSILIQAENFTSMSGVQNETTTDVGGGQNTGFLDAGDWMAYNNVAFSVPQDGRYKITYRVASLNGGGSLTLKELSNDSPLSTVAIPKTGGWQAWTDVTQDVTLTAGTHNFKLAIGTGGFNVNWFRLDPIIVDTTPPSQPTAAFDTTGKFVSGVAEAGSTVEVKNAASTVLGSATADAAGAYTVTLTAALINKESVNVTAKDAAGNVSVPKGIVAPDLTAPSQPTATFDTAGKIISGVAEAGSTVVVKNSTNTTVLGTATADAATGNYSITIPTALINAEVVNVTAKDSVGNVSVVRVVNAPDKTAPSQPTAAFDTTGKVISGMAEAGSTIEVKNSTNTASLGSVVVATDGTYSLTLTTALINKEVVNVTAKDAAGNVSTASQPVAPDKTPPAQPTAAFDTTGKMVSGVAELGSSVVVKNSSNTATLGTGSANLTTGAYSITLTTALINNESVNVTAQDGAGNISVPKAINAPDTTPPSQPTAAFDTAGKIISGVAEVGSTVVVKNNGNTTTLGSAVANATTGVYSITLPTALTNKETVNITAADAAGNISTPLPVIAPSVVVTNPTSILIQAENFTSMSGVQNETTTDVGGGQNTGYLDAGDWMAYNNVAFSVPQDGRYKITYRVASLNGGGSLTLKELSNDNPLSTVTVPKTGGWQTWTDVAQEVTLSAGTHNFKLAIGTGGFNVNWFKLDPVIVDTTPPAQPTAAFDTTGKFVSGIAEAGSTVEVKNAASTVLGSATADAAGAYTVTLTAALINKESVNVTAKDAAGNVSVAKAIVAPDLTAPSQPTAAFDTAGKVITGVAEAGSSVVVKNDTNTTVLGTATADATTGNYSITLTTALLNAEVVNVTAKDAVGNVSVARAVNAPDSTAPTQPTAAFDTTGKTVSGTAEAGSTVQVKNSAGTTVLGSATAAANGSYSIVLATALINKETVNVAAKDAAGNTSVARVIVAPDLTPPAQPSAAFNTAGKVVSGSAEVGSLVEIKNSTNTALLGSATADATGNYSITLVTALLNAEVVNVTAKDTVGNLSIARVLNAPDTTAPSQPTAAFDTAGKIISGVAEAGSTVVVKNSGNTTTLGSAVANASTGAYSITLPTALTNKETVNITAADAAGNVSTPLPVIAPSVVVTNPTSILIQAENFTSMSGVQNETTTDVGGGQNTGYLDAGDWMAYNNVAFSVPQDGRYKITYRVASLNGGGSLTLKELSNDNPLSTVAVPKTGGWQTWTDVTQDVTLTAGTHNFKLAIGTGGFNVNWFRLDPVVVDTTPPAQPTAAFDTTGKFVSGVAEAGSTVEVKNAASTVLGSATADAAGAYTVTLATALINKESVNVTAKDAAGNVSTASQAIAPDKTPPAQPTAAFDTTGKMVSGVAELGSSVVVKNSSNTATLGTGSANLTTGAYSITLTTALINNESVNVTAQDGAGNISVPKAINAPDTTPPSQPTAAFDTAGKIISGVAEVGSTVVVKNSGNTTTLGSAVANAATGAYSITLPTALTNKETVNITAADAAGNVSTPLPVIAPSVVVTNPTSILIQAESFTSMSGVQNETTTDVGGGQNTGYLDAGDWMAYNNVAFSVPQDGRYKITYRVASLNGGGSLTLKELSNDNPLSTVAVPKTGAWQTWTDVTQEITLGVGSHNFKIAVGAGGFNINWFKLEPVVTATGITAPLKVASDIPSNAITANTLAAPIAVTTLARAQKSQATTVTAMSQTDSLIQAMAAFAPPSAAETKPLVGFADHQAMLLANPQ